MARKPVPYAAKLAASLGIAVVSLGLAATVYFAMTASKGNDVFAQCRINSLAAGGATIGGPFELVSEDGETVTQADILTKPTLMYFGYSYCPDVCPIDGVRNAEAATLLREAGYDVGDVFVTVDPERDTPEVMKEFTDYFDDEMIGLTGSEEQVAAAAKTFRVYFAKNGDGEDYLMDHSTFTYLMLPDLSLAEIFRRDAPAEEMVKVTSCIIDAL